jgi:hypothetical protein
MQSVAASSRRSILRALGSLGALGPLVPRLEALAAGPPPRRLVVLAHGSGMSSTYPGPWVPGPGFTFVPGSILEPFAAVRDKVVVLSGIVDQAAADVGSHMHMVGTMLTGKWGGAAAGGNGGSASNAGAASVDQILATRLEGQTPFKSLELGVHVTSRGGSRGTISHKGPLAPVPVETSPYAAFDRLFAGVAGVPGAAAPTDAVLARIRRERQSVLDFVKDDLARAARLVGRDDRARLDGHLTALRATEKRLQNLAVSAGVVTGCLPPTPGRRDLKWQAPDTLYTSVAQQAHVPEVTRLQMEIARAALACDRTRVVTLMMSGFPCALLFAWLDGKAFPTDFHSLTHRDRVPGGTSFELASTFVLKGTRWFAAQVRTFLDQLEAVREEGGRTLLDNTMVVWTADHGNPTNHSIVDFPYLLAGATGFLRTGQYIHGNRAPHNRVLTAMAHWMGHEVATIGDPKYGAGVLAGLT